MSKIVCCVVTSYSALPEILHVSKFFCTCEWCWRNNMCPVLFTSWLVWHICKLCSDADTVKGFVFPVYNTCFKDLRLSGEGWILWDLGRTVGRNSDSCWKFYKTWRFYKISVFLGFSEVLCSGYEDGQIAVLYGLLHMFVDLCNCIWFIVLGIHSVKIMHKMPVWCQHQCLFHLPGTFRKWRICERQMSPVCGISAAERCQELHSFWTGGFEPGVSWEAFNFRLLP